MGCIMSDSCPAVGREEMGTDRHKVRLPYRAVQCPRQAGREQDVSCE